MEMSKKILYISFSAAALLSIALIICTIINVDCSNLAIVAGAVWAEVSVHTAVYSKKAAMENKLKIMGGMIEKYSTQDKVEPDVIVQLFDGVSREG